MFCAEEMDTKINANSISFDCLTALKLEVTPPPHVGETLKYVRPLNTELIYTNTGMII